MVNSGKLEQLERKLKNWVLRERYFWREIRNPSLLSLIPSIFLFIYAILDFTIITFDTRQRLGITAITFGCVFLVIFFGICIKIMNESKKARNILIYYLESLEKKYDEKKKEFKLIDRDIGVGKIIEEEGKRTWDFSEKQLAPSWLVEKILTKEHLLIEGDMGTGKTMLMMSIANTLANKAKEKLREKQLTKLTLPIFIPMKLYDIYTKPFLNFGPFKSKDGLMASDYFAWLTHVMTNDLKIGDKYLTDSQKELLYKYLKITFTEKRLVDFSLLFDAYDEFAYKRSLGNISPLGLFKHTRRDQEEEFIWKGSVVISTRPLILKMLIELNKVGPFDSIDNDGKNFVYVQLAKFTTSEIETYLTCRPIYLSQKEKYKNWRDFKDEVIEFWGEHFEDEWELPLFLWILSSYESIEEMPTTKKELFLKLYSYYFDWYYFKKDEDYREPMRDEWQGYHTKTIVRKIIFDRENPDNFLQIPPATLYNWVEEILKDVAMFLSKEAKNGLTKTAIKNIVDEMNRLPQIAPDDNDSLYNIFKQTIDDGSFIICPSYDENNLPIYSFSQMKLQEIFTALKFPDLSEEAQIAVLKKILPRLHDIRETIVLCWQLYLEDLKDKQKVKDLFIKACPDLEFLFILKSKNPKDLLTWRIRKIELIKDKPRIVIIDLQMMSVKEINFLMNSKNQLHALDLSWTKFKPLPSLEDLTKLQRLDLSLNQLTDLTPLEKLSKLQELNLSGNFLTDLTPLEKLPNLGVLDLRENQLTDITPLEKLPNLGMLGLSENWLTDLTPLEKLPNLWMLDLSVSQFDDLTPLEKLINLNTLFLRIDKYESLDISSLISLEKLIVIDIDNSPQLLCKKELIDKITCPALLEIKNHILPIN